MQISSDPVVVQESGRAGRDDKKADCIVFWRLADMFRLSTMVFTEQTGLDNLYSVVQYCLNADECVLDVQINIKLSIAHF